MINLSKTSDQPSFRQHLFFKTGCCTFSAVLHSPSKISPQSWDNPDKNWPKMEGSLKIWNIKGTECRQDLVYNSLCICNACIFIHLNGSLKVVASFASGKVWSTIVSFVHRCTVLLVSPDTTQIWLIIGELCWLVLLVSPDTLILDYWLPIQASYDWS